MRSFLVLLVALSSVSHAATAQGPRLASRWTVSAGPEWIAVGPKSHVLGMRVRAEYDLTKPASVFGLRFEAAALWNPTQNYFYTGSFGGTGFSVGGTEQRMDLMIGLAGSFSPIPHARFSPYVTTGVYARQQRIYGSRFFSNSGPGLHGLQRITTSRGDIIGAVGLGLRMGIGDHTFQVEYRNISGAKGLTFGMRLPF